MNKIFDKCVKCLLNLNMIKFGYKRMIGKFFKIICILVKKYGIYGIKFFNFKEYKFEE